MWTEKAKKQLGQTLAKNGLANPMPNSILDLSTRTTSAIISRMITDKAIGCSNCGWAEAIGDIHHINGKTVDDYDNHKNLCYLCPNCHRLVHTGKNNKNKLFIKDLVNLEDFLGDKWQKYYYGFRPNTNNEELMKRININNEELIIKIKNSNINFKRPGWRKYAAEIMEINFQAVNKWMKKHMLEFYEKECSKNNRIIK